MAGWLSHSSERTGLITTITVHVLLLLLFLLLGLTHQVPEPIAGTLVQFGYDEAGSGDELPQETEASSSAIESENEEVEEASSSAEEAVEEEVLTQEDSPVEIEKSTEEIAREKAEQQRKAEEIKKQKEEAAKRKKQEEDKQKLNALASKWGKSNSTSSGTSGGDGIEGRPDGGPDPGNGGSGGIGGGNGYKWSLDGRSMLGVPPKIENDIQEEGYVKVKIVVDRDGQVIKATPGVSGTTITSATILKKAYDAAMKCRFNADPAGPYQQIGEITFEFILD